MKVRRGWLFVSGTVLAVALVAGGYHQFASRRTPAGQPPLGQLTARNLDEFRHLFNDSADVPRVVALLSPT